MFSVLVLPCVVLIVVRIGGMEDRWRISLIRIGDKRVCRVIDDYVGSLYSAKLFVLGEVGKILGVEGVILFWDHGGLYRVYRGAICVGLIKIVPL